MAKIFKFPHKNIHVAMTLSDKARELHDQDSNSKAAVGLYQEAVRYLLIDARSRRREIRSLLLRERAWLLKYRAKNIQIPRE